MNIKDDYTIISGGGSEATAAAVSKNSPLLPANIRMLIIGKSNCGKTTVLFNLLLQSGWIDYTDLCLVIVCIRRYIKY